MGSWMLYSLGTENQNLPGYIVLGSGLGGAKNWRSAFLPGAFKSPYPARGSQRGADYRQH